MTGKTLVVAFKLGLAARDTLYIPPPPPSGVSHILALDVEVVLQGTIASPRLISNVNLRACLGIVSEAS